MALVDYSKRAAAPAVFFILGPVLAFLLLPPFLRWFEGLNLYHPSKDFSILPQTYGLPYEDAYFRAEDGPQLHGWLLPAAPFAASVGALKEQGPLAPLGLTLLLCHGNAGNISGRVTKANVLHQLGLGVFLFDYRGYGRSQGKPSEQGTYRDAEAAYRWLTEAKGVPAGKIVFYGESLGSAVAMELALMHPPRALLLENPFSSTVAMGKVVFPWLPVSRMVRYKYDNLSKAPRLRSPLLVLHSKQDDIIPYEQGRAVFDAAPEPKVFVELKGDHNEGWLESGPRYTDGIRSFLEYVFKFRPKAQPRRGGMIWASSGERVIEETTVLRPVRAKPAQ